MLKVPYLIGIASAVGFLTACVPTTSNYLYKSKADVTRADRDDFECELAASRAVPEAMRVGTTPTYTTPIQTNCYNIGYTVQCNTTGGQVYGGQTYSYDANSKLRAEHYARCMVSRGWGVVELPNCDPEKVPTSLRAKLGGKLRPPAEGACYYGITERAGNVVYAAELSK